MVLMAVQLVLWLLVSISLRKKRMQISFYLTLATLLLIVYYPCINKVAHHNNIKRNPNS